MVKIQNWPHFRQQMHFLLSNVLRLPLIAASEYQGDNSADLLNPPKLVTFEIVPIFHCIRDR